MTVRRYTIDEPNPHIGACQCRRDYSPEQLIIIESYMYGPLGFSICEIREAPWEALAIHAESTGITFTWRPCTEVKYN